MLVSPKRPPALCPWLLCLSVVTLGLGFAVRGAETLAPPSPARRVVIRHQSA